MKKDSTKSSANYPSLFDNYVLSIAGHDPSGGAGITSDLKTFEAHGFYGLTVCTAITIQNDTNFKQSIWTKPEVILLQIETLFERFEISVVKIGIIENWKTLSLILDKLHELNPRIKVVLDPVFKASSGFDFHYKESQEMLDKIWKQCFIITPNYDEIQSLYPNLNIKKTIEHISKFTRIYLKGGHRSDLKGWDELYYDRTSAIEIFPIYKTVYQKHGSGCVLSSSLACNIASNYPIKDAAINSKIYIETYLRSSKGLLGTHKMIVATG
ncbi:hydroxymethylpyrimidine/phosphomethylpyrimidine kinase [Tamlana sp. 2_MG-2023]|uniref:hydroxymethylpyrimidine/phosphomethylpyrimidine kinase n=1 Tax=unclassified Tamlana TaxID=2614803 RepID=UPI0026E426EF|nr:MULTISPECIES: hydroxymethylpyrimidine/phosphomethylpyrimidine kinase [unclassified Tamlana]MDO6759697.1 hydroxymethylpyrimidine/phosphomethylpyrimidine kinase [Tamlana sp. 2_MG-2023]MDO6791320.1 hydroxymethylpyrimidine/phosphomethylpyrimidine kinase [Tamlana sp. 1_MG-2023]